MMIAFSFSVTTKISLVRQNMKIMAGCGKCSKTCQDEQSNISGYCHHFFCLLLIPLYRSKYRYHVYETERKKDHLLYLDGLMLIRENRGRIKKLNYN
jgi:hypothetical protein